MTWIYSQSTGILKHNGQFVAKGYAGKGIGKNDPKMETASSGCIILEYVYRKKMWESNDRQIEVIE